MATDTDPVLQGFSPKAVTAVRAAEALAQRLGDKSVATGHLVYGLALDRSVVINHVFQDLNVDPDMFAQYVDSLPREPEGPGGSPYNRHVHTVFERARELAKKLGAKEVIPEHLLVAMMSVRAGSCYETLKEFSIEPDYVAMLVMEAMGLEETDIPEWF
ncbi:MAG TPA: Clp protease N-terminal domain-containing protein [Planctomycetota bacterium]|nr:Clp protease N-terminal domain-containing protein [Planctomycetota bacterium]